ncbi:class I adenylate-forming enzyme family protein, partial [Oceanospirillum sp. HFRX-1_2]
MHNICTILQKLANERPEDEFAFFSDEGEMSYGELWEEANKEYKNIKKMGKNRKVIIKTKTEKELLVRIISHWINGNMITIVPIDISEIRLESICKTLNPTVLETILNGSVSTEIISDQEMKDSPDDAICVFTSGSTGAAKGVVITHSNIIEGCKNVISAKKITKDDKGLCLLPLTHINGFITTFCSIIFSNSKVVYNQAPYDAITIAKLVYDQQCTWMSAVPFHYTEMVKKSDLISPDKLESLRFCRSASAPLPISVFEAFVNHYQIPLVETMGMTEATGQIFSNSIEPGKQVSGAVGFPIGFEAKIVDINGNKLPDNSEGELLISGPALMREYYNSPETTNKALINGWLRTGDLATIDKDGLVRITGRIKDIAIFSGENISLSSLENKIIDIFGFTEVAAKSIPDNTFGEKIEFYIENKSKISIKNNELVKKISELLPSASAIKSIYIVDHI